MKKLEIGSIYSFNTTTPSVLGHEHTNVKLISKSIIEDDDSISNMNAIKQQLKDEEIGNKIFLIFKTVSGSTFGLLESWIADNSVEETDQLMKITIDINKDSQYYILITEFLNTSAIKHTINKIN